MRKFYLLSAALLGLIMSAHSQAYLVPEQGHKVAFHFSDTVTVQTFDVDDLFFYFDDGDTISQVDPTLGGTSRKYGLPADYALVTYPSFLNISPDGASLWAGYTDSDNVDARIYSIDPETGVWDLKAKMASNWDLDFWNDSILVSGLNSADYNAPNAIFVLDTSGLNQHRAIVETGGNSAGLAIDSDGNLYYGTSYLAGSNALYRWDSTELAAVIETPGAAPLQIADAEKLSDLPMGAYDCEVDEGDHVVFSMNVWGATQVLARWNGIQGDGLNYDTLAVSDLWLGKVKSRGDYTIQEPGNSLFTIAFGQPLADLHTSDYPPLLINALPVITGQEGVPLDPLDLNQYFIDMDDPGGLSFAVSVLSDPGVANFTVEDGMLSGSFGSAGQANLVLEATSAGRSVSALTVVGTWPVFEGDFSVAGFEELNLDPESYWNGSDRSGTFSSGLALFHNDFNPDYYSWSGWSYSNTTDTTTAGYENQYSTITGGGFAGDIPGGNFGTSSLYGPSVIDFTLDKAHSAEGFFVTNSTYSALSMEQGDWAAKKFGGIDGTDPDYFKLLVWGRTNNASTDTLDFYLADFRFDEPEKDYIIETWQWVDLSSLGKVDSLIFGLESSDVGEWGMNTPAYFCLDDLYIHPDQAPLVASPLSDVSVAKNAVDMQIDLSSVFYDPDDPGVAIDLAVKSNSNEVLVGAVLEGDQLTLSFAADRQGESDLVIEGRSMGLAVTDTFRVDVESPNGISPGNTQTIKIFPNPTSGVFMVSTGQESPAALTVYDLTGVVVHKDPNYVSGEAIHLAHLSAGTYLIRIESLQGVWTELMMKK
jgi:hypothetical protein